MNGLTASEEAGLRDVARRCNTFSYDELVTVYKIVRAQGKEDCGLISNSLAGKKSKKQCGRFFRNWERLHAPFENHVRLFNAVDVDPTDTATTVDRGAGKVKHEALTETGSQFEEDTMVAVAVSLTEQHLPPTTVEPGLEGVDFGKVVSHQTSG